MKFTVNEKEVELKYSLRAMMMYENITEKSFSPTTMTDIITLFYCIVVSSSKDYSYQFDDFLDYLDDHSELMTEFSNWIMDISATTDKLKKD